MFEKEFYPTPFSLANKLLEKYKYNDKVVSILDPSAGKGDLLKPFKHLDDKKLFGFEINIQLCSILRNEGITVLGNDFFNFEEGRSFDLVVMNPPFSNGIDHLMHAYGHVDTSEIVCILPVTVLDGSNKKKQLLSELIKNKGQVEELGSAFFDSERKTNVEVCVITLKKEKYNRNFMFDFEYKKDDKSTASTSKEIVKGGIVQRKRIEELVDRYNKSIESFESFFFAISKMRYELNGLVNEFLIDELVASSCNTVDYQTAYNDFVDNLKKGCWQQIFQETKFMDLISSRVEKDFKAFLEQSSDMSFSLENINMVFKSLLHSKNDISNKAIEDAFDILTKYHKDNRCHIEGWKTNDRWKVKKKFILPSVVKFDNRFGFWETYSYHSYDNLRDIEIALCHITGKKPSEINSFRDSMQNADRRQVPRLIVDTEFFQVTCYKKGTAHFLFKDTGLWDEFNKIACAGKKWLPE